VSPINVLVAYGLANILAVIPITPGGLGIIEGILIPALVGFGVPLDKAGVAVLGYRLVNFWLPIPVGGISYLTLRFESVGWRQRLSKARDEIIEHPSQSSWNGKKPPDPAPTPSDQTPMNEHTVDAPVIATPDIADTSVPPSGEEAETHSRPGQGGAASG
jgi:hypothetical protein